MELSTRKQPDEKNWIDLIGETVQTRKGNDDQEVGSVEAVNNEILVIRRTLLGLHYHYYYIPITEVEGWDGNTIWLKISREELEREYVKHDAPDPQKYYVKTRPSTNKPSSYRQVRIVQSQHTEDTAFTASGDTSSPTYQPE
jgi:hypothetical protein